jgi:hypothetical protein
MTIEVLSVNRIGQISGTTDPSSWPYLVDPVGNPLLTDTGRWNAIGFDEGANTERSDGHLYIFSGDVATDQVNTPLNADLVAWVDEPAPLRNGGHLAMGWNFQLPTTGPGIEGQPDWQFCLKCSALFWNGDPNFKGRCSLGGTHDTFGLGLNFSLPFEPTGIQGQHQWRFCGKCGSLFFEGYADTGVCPAGDTHVAPETSWRFVIPVTPGSQGGQPDWRYCDKCHGLFYDGYPSKGICVGSPGGGIHINAVTKDDGRFDPFSAPEPIGYTGSLETPNGAFSYDGRMYVFAGFADQKYSGRKRPGDPQPGQYLFSKADPKKPGPYDTEFMLSPKLGWCARDESRTVFESHMPLGFHFLLPHDLPPAPSLRSGWRCCGKCEAVYFDGDALFKGVCQRGGPHEPDPLIPDVFSLEVGVPEDVQNQSNWKLCRNCFALYWSVDDNDAGLCSASGRHVSTGELFRVPQPRCWVVLFGTAGDKVNQDQPIMARFSPDLLTWSDEAPLFDPNREHAYGIWMHDPATGDRINPDLPPAQPPPQNSKAWAYGAFLIDRYTTWDPERRVLNLTYLMSPNSPYQVQLMETTVRLPDPIVG